MERLKSSAATVAIVTRRLRAQWRLIAVLAATSFALGWTQGNPLTAPYAFCEAAAGDRLAWLIQPLFSITSLGIVGALCNQNVAAVRELQMLEQSAPLYGRQLARARAVVPCISVACSTFTYWLGQSSNRIQAPGYLWALILSAVLCSVLVALSAGLRTGRPRLFYVALAICSAFIALQIASNVPCYSAPGIIAEITFCALVGFTALRGYGETLARYDPSD